jgi:hypothetical protein
MITVTKSNLHWNYFIALEDDLGQVSRYVEFCGANLGVFSIELAHLLLAAASEVDVMAKCVCAIVDPQAKPGKINQYQAVLTAASQRGQILDMATVKVLVPRYGMDFIPWENWARGKSPDWWKSYNNVKHVRDQHFNEATLQHALNAVGALLILNYVYYRLQFKLDGKGLPGYAPSVVFKLLSSWPRLMTLPQDLHNKKGQ